MKGFFKKLLNINITTRTYSEESIPEEILRNYLGGKGLGSYLLYRHNPPRVNPLSPENCLIFSTGCVTDTILYGSARYGVYTKSPQTEIYSESYSGGKAGLALSRTGYDAIRIEGSSTQPIFIEISERGAEFHPADQVWGMETDQAENYLKKALGQKGAEALVIGPAGENLVKFSVLQTDYWRSAGRTGVGAVMGAKKIKGIISYGNRSRPLAKERELELFCRETFDRMKQDQTLKAFRKFGTPMLVSIMNVLGGFPTQYWSKGRLDGWENISAESLQEHCDVESRPCPRCFLECKKLLRVKQGKFKGLTVGGPEYQTIYAFGGLCMIGNIEEIIFLNDLCDRLGMDTITAGNLAALAIEATRRGIIKERLEYGDAEGIAQLLRKISRKEGVGADLAEGIRHVSKKWDLEAIAVHVKGLEPPGYDPRVLKGMGLAYVTADRGACHSRSGLYLSELRGDTAPEKTEGKAKLLVEEEDRLTIFDTLILCRFYSDFISWKELGRIAELIIGESFDQARLRAIAKNIAILVRSFNLREGISKSDNNLPRRFFKEALGDEKRAYSQEELNQMIEEYYKLRGWDSDDLPPPSEA